MDLDAIYAKLRDFTHRIMIAISIEPSGSLPPSYDKRLHRGGYGSAERDTRAESDEATA